MNDDDSGPVSSAMRSNKAAMLQELLGKAEARIALLEKELAATKVDPAGMRSHWDSDSHVQRNLVLKRMLAGRDRGESSRAAKNEPEASID